MSANRDLLAGVVFADELGEEISALGPGTQMPARAWKRRSRDIVALRLTRTRSRSAERSGRYRRRPCV